MRHAVTPHAALHAVCERGRCKKGGKRSGSGELWEVVENG
jgi:hypothetical protein